MIRNCAPMFDHTAAEEIHKASIALLDDPGVKIEHDGIVDLLLSRGAKAGSSAQVVRISAGLIEECLAAAPRSVTLTGRADTDIPNRGTSPLIWSAPGMQFSERNAVRPLECRDMANLTRLFDQLSCVDGVFGMTLADAPRGTSDITGLRIMAENTSKHIRAMCFTPEGAEYFGEMKSALGGTPWFSMGFTAHGPLRWTNLALEIFKRTTGHRIPVTINGEPMAGTSGPVTLAGAAAVGNAEILAGLVVNQVLEPGRPCIYNLGLAHVFDMRTAIAVTGGPENHLLAAFSAALGRFYGLPSCSWVSTESMIADAQAAMEKTAGFLTHLQNGVDVIWGVGQLESEMTLSPAQAVIDDEIIGYIRRYLAGVDLSPNALALDVTREVGIAGHFLEHEHTLRHFREELYEPRILCRVRRAPWAEVGSRDLTAVAAERAEALMRSERRTHLSPDQARALRQIEARYLAR